MTVRIATKSETESVFERNLNFSEYEEVQALRRKNRKAEKEGHRNLHCMTCRATILALCNVVHCQEKDCPMRKENPLFRPEEK